jgi:hypothetical protein
MYWNGLQELGLEATSLCMVDYMYYYCCNLLLICSVLDWRLLIFHNWCLHVLMFWAALIGCSAHLFWLFIFLNFICPLLFSSVVLQTHMYNKIMCWNLSINLFYKFVPFHSETFVPKNTLWWIIGPTVYYIYFLLEEVDFN